MGIKDVTEDLNELKRRPRVAVPLILTMAILGAVGVYVKTRIEEHARRDSQPPKAKAEAGIPNNLPDMGPGEDGLVVLLPGAAGDEWAHEFATGGDARNKRPAARDFGRMLGERSGDLGQVLSYYVWNWHTTGPQGKFESLFGEDRPNQHRGKLLAKELSRWRSENPGKKIYLVAGSGGGWVAALACEAEDENASPVLATDFFERIIFLCTVLDKDRDLRRIAKKARHGVFNYWSALDRTLKVPLFKVSNAAGLHGFTADVPGLRQLEYTDKYSNAGYVNNGDHLQCYQRAFAESFLVPLFNVDPGRVPSDWN